MKNLKKIAAVLAASLTVNALAFANVFSVSADGAEVIGTATLKGQMGTYAYWGEGNSGNTDNITSTPAEITSEGGQYTASWNITGDGTGTIEFLTLEFDSKDENYITKDTYPNLSVTIDSVKIDGEQIDYTMSADSLNLAYYGGGTGSTRVYFQDHWGNNGGSQDIPYETIVQQSIEVTFTISNLEPAVNYGDIDGNGVIDTFDAYYVLREYALLGAGYDGELDEYQTTIGDVTGDGALDTFDAYYILLRCAQVGAGVEATPYPVEEKK